MHWKCNSCGSSLNSLNIDDDTDIHYLVTMYPVLYFKWQPLEIIEIGNMNLSVWYLRFHRFFLCCLGAIQFVLWFWINDWLYFKACIYLACRVPVSIKAIFRVKFLKYSTNNQETVLWILTSHGNLHFTKYLLFLEMSFHCLLFQLPGMYLSSNISSERMQWSYFWLTRPWGSWKHLKREEAFREGWGISL